MNHTQRVQLKHAIGMALAPALMRYDFSEADTPKKWAKLTYEASEAFMAAILPELEAAAVKDVEAAKAQALASMVPPNSVTTAEQPKVEDKK